MVMYKKAQGGEGPIAFIFGVLVFLFLWFIWIGRWIAEAGQNAITNAGMTGMEAFFYANLNVWVLIGLILGIMGFMYFSSRG